jgi:NAD(P)-dependent dehydrogenase (short-subunit alcohol dehydrogenase family)
MDLKGASAVVTGGGSGLGRATAVALAETGVKVVIVDLPGSQGEAVAQTIGRGAVFVPADVLQGDDVSRAIDTASQLGELRVAVNCAGIATPGKIVGRSGVLELEKYAQVIGVNLIGTFNVLRLAAERIGQSSPSNGERGVIINTASVAAFDGQIGQAAYSSSKAGVVGLTLPAAREFAPALIRVMAIAPGLFETPMLAGLPQEVRDSLGRQTPHPARLGRATEYASLVLHILENPMLNGEVIRLDGAIRLAAK